MNICGRHYTISNVKEGVRPRILVDGINHQGGSPIRFKSVENAERHIRNMRLEIADNS